MLVKDVKKILFIAEGVSLAHIGRPLALANSLKSDAFQVYFACTPAYKYLVEQNHIEYRTVDSIAPEQFRNALRKGSPIYSYENLCSYYEQETALIQSIKPDLVVGDFRMSLSSSAAKQATPYANLTNAYWSPYAAFKRYPLPDLPLNYFFGRKLARLIYETAQPLFFAWHAAPINKLRKAHGLETHGELRNCYVSADHTFYCDPPSLIPTVDLPTTHSYLGHLSWEPNCDRPAWLDELPRDKPLIYITLGSSGRSELLPTIVKTVAELPLTTVVATAGRMGTAELPKTNNVYVADYLPGTEASRLADIVISNGGSATAYQALSQATPVLGIPTNLDQFLTMMHIEQQGSGVLLGSDSLSMKKLKHALSQMLSKESFKQKAAELATEFQNVNAEKCFENFLANTLN